MRATWLVIFGKSTRRFYTKYHVEQFARALRMNGTRVRVVRG